MWSHREIEILESKHFYPPAALEVTARPFPLDEVAQTPPRNVFALLLLLFSCNFFFQKNYQKILSEKNIKKIFNQKLRSPFLSDNFVEFFFSVTVIDSSDLIFAT